MDFHDVPADVRRTVDRYLGVADRLLPGRITGFYLVGSVALGAYRPGRSDIDFVAVLDAGASRREGERDLSPADLRRLRLVHLASGLRTAPAALGHGHLGLPGTCNGVFVWAADLRRPVTTIVPLASHVGARLRPGRGFDVNPVQWTTLARHGVAVRGPAPASLGLDPEPGRLRQWNLDNLATYWVPWAEAARRRPGLRWRTRPGWATAWGVLGAPRLHHTVATGDVISKEIAGEWAKATLDARHHAIVDEGLAWWRGEPADPAFKDVATRARATADLVLATADAAARL
jgi:Domain of unknown function (DUF4111)/Nucleotidyltransferase domain